MRLPFLGNVNATPDPSRDHVSLEQMISAELPFAAEAQRRTQAVRAAEAYRLRMEDRHQAKLLSQYSDDES